MSSGTGVKHSSTITISAGIGDLITFLTRIPEYKRIEKIDSVNISFVGGWDKTQDLAIEICQPLIERGLISSISKNQIYSDRLDNWIPEDAPLKYKMELPFLFPVFPKDQINTPEQKYCVIQPITTNGNSRGFEKSRYLEVDKWVRICDKLHELGFLIVVVGCQLDRGYINDFCCDFDYCGRLSICQTIHLLNSCQMFVGTNSFCWEITMSRGIPTLCLDYIQIHLRLHVPTMDPPKYGVENLRIDISRDINKILQYIEDLNV